MDGEIQHCNDNPILWEDICISSKQVICIVCNEQFLGREILANHLLNHIGARPYCTPCKAVFITFSQLYEHLLIYHGVSEIELLVGDRQCYECELNPEAEFIFHYANHIKQFPYKCETCKLSFCHETDFIIHSHLHKPDEEATCDVCTETFAEKRECLHHVVTHNNHALFLYFPNSLDDCNNSFSSRRNANNILNSSDNNVLGIDSECKNHLVSSENSDAQHSGTNCQTESNLSKDAEQFQETHLYGMEELDENDRNRRFPTVINLTCRDSKLSLKELWVILHKLPDCIYNTYSCSNSIYVDKLNFSQTSNCCTSGTIGGRICCPINDFPHVCGSEKDVLPALNEEENVSDLNLNMEEYCVISTNFDLSDSPDSVLADLLSEESSVSLQLYSDEMSCDYGFKIVKDMKVKVYIPKSLWACNQEEFSSFLKDYELCVLNDGFKFVSLYICETAENISKPHKLICIKGKMGLRFLIPDCSRKPCVKLHRLCDNILHLYINNQPVILKKNIVQETFSNTDQLGDCSSVIEFDLELLARVVDNNYVEPDNFVFEDDHMNERSVQNCESNSNILCHLDQVKLRDVSVQLDRLSDDDIHLKSVSSAEVENDNFIDLCEMNSNRDDQQMSVDKEKIKNIVKKSKKKGISSKPQKKKVFKKSLLRKKCMLLQRYIKSCLPSNSMNSFLLNFKYSELAFIFKKLKKSSKKNQIDEECISFVRRLINSANYAMKNIKRKKFPSSRCIHAKNLSDRNISEKGENISLEFSSEKKNFIIHFGYQAEKESAAGFG